MDTNGFHLLLRQLYDEMIPLSYGLVNVVRGIAGFGAIFYVFSRVWRHMANQEQIDPWPLLRPVAIGCCLLMWPVVMSVFNGILEPITMATDAMVEQQNFDIKKYREMKDEIERQAILNNPEFAWLEDNETFDKKLEEMGIDVGGRLGMYAQRASYNLVKQMRSYFREVLEIVYQGVAMIIDIVRTFFLIILTILGPVVFGFAVFDGLQASLSNWIARYINVFLWLPVSNIFGAIVGKLQVLMLQKDIQDMKSGGTFDTTDTTYIIFLMMAIVGYCCVPTVASWIIQSCGAGAYNKSLSGAAGAGASMTGAGLGAATGGMAGAFSSSSVSGNVNGPALLRPPVV